MCKCILYFNSMIGSLQFLGTCIINNELCIITEYMKLGSVYKLLHNENFEINWTHIEKFAIDTAQGMLYLHKCNPPVLHRDLKVPSSDFKLIQTEFKFAGR